MHCKAAVGCHTADCCRLLLLLSPPLQIEGAFMMGVGHVLHEEVVEDEQTGRNVTNTTWEYKPPGLAELPQVQ